MGHLQPIQVGVSYLIKTWPNKACEVCVKTPKMIGPFFTGYKIDKKNFATFSRKQKFLPNIWRFLT